MARQTFRGGVALPTRFAGALACLLMAGVALDAQGTHTDRARDSVGRRRIQPLPALAAAPETGLQFGATVLAVWEPAPALDTRPSSLMASALRTSRQQTRLRVEAERWSRGNSRRVAGSIQWQEFPLPYFGIGNSALASAEETFTPKGTEATLALYQLIAASWYATAGIRHVEQRIAADSTGVLRNGAIRGSRGGKITEWSAGVMIDTRDNLFAPRNGRWVQLSYSRSVDGVWSDFAYGTMRVDARAYRALATEHVIATQFQLTSVDGSAPFDQLALVGNSDILRGYARGRYRDRAMAAVQTEYRSPIRHRLGGTVFAGAGTIGGSIGALGSGKLLPTYGAGLRVQLDQRQRTGIRADYGRGRDGASGLYIGFNQAF